MQFALGSKALAAGYRVEEFETIGSTNAEAMTRARQGDNGRLWIASTGQSAGRGRRGSQWATPPGNLAASLLLVVDANPGVAATLGFVAGLALDESLRSLAPDLAISIAGDGAENRQSKNAGRLRLKWPNDVLFDGGKLAGILLEAEPVANGKLAVVIGIGVNVLSVPAELPYPGASLVTLGLNADAPLVFEGLSDAWASIEQIWDGGRGFSQIRALWLDRAIGIGEDVVIRIGEDTQRGVFETIDGEGRLVIVTNDGSQRAISAGEVHFGAMTKIKK